MSRRSMEVTTDLVLRAYRHGLFPMAEGRAGDKLFWLDPIKRGVLPLDGFHLPRRLLRTVLSDTFTVTADRNFAGTIAGCATPVPDRSDTWINPQIERLFTELFRMGHAHSVETWQDGTLVGGLYGVALAGRSSARACSASPAMPPRSRWCIWSRGCGWAAFSCWIPSS